MLNAITRQGTVWCRTNYKVQLLYSIYVLPCCNLCCQDRRAHRVLQNVVFLQNVLCNFMFAMIPEPEKHTKASAWLEVCSACSQRWSSSFCRSRRAFSSAICSASRARTRRIHSASASRSSWVRLLSASIFSLQGVFCGYC